MLQNGRNLIKRNNFEKNPTLYKLGHNRGLNQNIRRTYGSALKHCAISWQIQCSLFKREIILKLLITRCFNGSKIALTDQDHYTRNLA